MEERTGGICFIFMIIIIVMWVHIDDLKKTIAACSASIQNADLQILDMNDNLRGAKDAAWLSFDGMGEAIDNLEEGTTISNPCGPK